MPNATSAANVESSQIFDLWLSQWRLTILDSNSAQPILSAVLSSMLARSGEDAFWEYLQEFLAAQKPVSDSGKEQEAGTDLENPDIRRWLVECATQLPARQAKCLLEQLGSSYSLHGEDAAFWQIVERALNHAGIQPPASVTHRAI